MATTVDILNETFIDKGDLSATVESIAKKLDLQFNHFSPDQDDVWVLRKETLEIHYLSEDKFNELKKNKTYIEDYGNLFYITMYHSADEGQSLILFLKEFFNAYPDILVNCDDFGKPTHFLKKSDLDTYNGEEIEQFLRVKSSTV